MSEEVQKEDLEHIDSATNDLEATPNLFRLEYAKSNRAKCKKCKKAIQNKALRIGKSIFFKNKLVATYYHPSCAFLASRKSRNPANILDKIDKFDGVESITTTEKQKIIVLIDNENKIRQSKPKAFRSLNKTNKNRAPPPLPRLDVLD